MWWTINRSRLTGLIAAVLLILPLAVSAQESSPDTPIENLQFQGAELRSVLSFLADYGNVNTVIAPDVSGTVTIRLQNVRWREAMDIIGRTYDLAIVDDETGFIRVMLSEDYREELEKQSQHAANQMKLVPLQTKIVKISNSTAAVDDNRNESVVVASIELIANEYNKRAVDLRDQGKIAEAEQVLEDNAVYLETAAKKYKSKKLKKSAGYNRADKANLAPGRWKARRKVMRDNQYEADMQQAW